MIYFINSEFTEKYKICVEKLLNEEKVFLLESNRTNFREIIDSNLSHLRKTLIKGARLSEKELNISKKSLKPKKCLLRLDKEQTVQLEYIKKLKYESFK